jgi:tetratricopeptide (TPR) repeat protein
MEAEFLDLLASLRSDQRRLSEAMELLGRAIRIYEDLGESHLAGRSMLNQSLVLLYMGRPQEALTVLEQAATRVHAGDDLHLKIAVHHNQALALCELEDFRGAQRIVHEHHDLYEAPGEENLLLRRRWLEGKILAGLKNASEAMEILASVRRQFLRRADGYDAAMVSLDLALLHLKAGQYQEVKRLAEEMTSVFRSQEVHREAMAALMLFQEAVRREEATLDLVRRLALYLGRVRGRPGVPFTPEA